MFEIFKRWRERRCSAHLKYNFMGTERKGMVWMLSTFTGRETEGKGIVCINLYLRERQVTRKAVRIWQPYYLNKLNDYSTTRCKRLYEYNTMRQHNYIVVCYFSIAIVLVICDVYISNIHDFNDFKLLMCSLGHIMVIHFITIKSKTPSYVT